MDDKDDGFELQPLRDEHCVPLENIRSSQDLYRTEEQQQFLQQGKMSNGNVVDLVLVYVLPADRAGQSMLFNDARSAMTNDSKDVKQMKRRLYYESELTKSRVQTALNELRTIAEPDDLTRDKLHRAEHILRTRRLELEHEMGMDKRTVFVKIHAPLETLLTVAEEIKLFLPLRPMGPKDASEEEPQQRSRLATFMKSLQRPKTDSYEEEDYVAAAFTRRKINMFRHGNDVATREKMFTPAQRSMLVYHLLEATRFEPKKAHKKGVESESNVGIRKLMQSLAYTAAYSLHDSQCEPKEAADARGERTFLFQKWAQWKNWYRPQPMENIRHYFGEQIAFYFLWLGFYTKWLVLPGILGILVFIYGLSTFADQTDAKEVCDSNWTVCPICSTCKAVPLSDACGAYKFSWVFDNNATIAVAFFMSMWATLFYEFWKRETNRTAFDWDVMEFRETEPQRPQFHGIFRIDPVTGLLARFYPTSKRVRTYLISFLVIFFMLSLVIWAVISVIVFRLVVRQSLSKSDNKSLQNSAPAITSILSAILNLIAIVILNKIYFGLARTLTEWENHEKQSHYDQAFTLKVFLFSFVNTFSSIFYIAYFKGSFVGRPGSYNTLFGVRQDACPDHGCMFDLTIQLAIVMVGKQIASNIQEIVIPQVMDWYKTRQFIKKLQKSGDLEAGQREVDLERKGVITRWQDDLDMVAYNEELGLFSEYLEMVIQFGFITIFVAAFPLAPFMALLNNIAEIHVDALKLVRNTRRPIAFRAEDIGIWGGILSTMGMIAVISNAFVIGFTSTFIPKAVYKAEHDGSLQGYISELYAYSPVVGDDCYYRGFRDDQGNYNIFNYQVLAGRLAFVIGFEHVVFFLKFMLMAAVPDVPEDIRIQVEKEHYQARKALEDHIFVEEEEEQPLH